MNTNCTISSCKFSLFGLLISCLLLGSGCSDITTGEALGVIIGTGGINETDECEINFTQPDVKWRLDFNNEKIIVAGEADGVVVVFNWTAQQVVTALGIDKNNGTRLWSHVITLKHFSCPRTYFGDREVLIYTSGNAIRLDLISGNVIDEFDFPLYAKRMIFHNNDYYLITDPCDKNNTFGLYQYKAIDREQFKLIYAFTDWPHNGTFLNFFEVTLNSQNQPFLIFTASFPWDGENECVVKALDLNGNRIVWTVNTKSVNHYFGSQNNVYIFGDKLLIARRRLLTLYTVDKGELIWETRNYDPAGFYNSKTLLKEGRLYVQDNYEAKNFCFDFASGAELWNYTSGMTTAAYFKDDYLIWGGLEGTATMAYLDKENGMIEKTMEQPWSSCPYAWFELLDNTSASADIIIAYDGHNVIGLAY